MTRIASHRGGTLEFGDSTPRGFSATAQMAVEEVEFDVHPTIDGVIMVHHDATLEGTTDRSGALPRVALKVGAKEKGQIVIDFHGWEHLNSLLERQGLSGVVDA